MEQRYIDSIDALHRLCSDIHPATHIAMDTEFMREKTYTAQFCLLQLATDSLIACIDPLVIEDLSPLWVELYREGLTLVLHAARQDLEILVDCTGTVPQHIFDTQIAAALLGHGEQIGYAGLVKNVLQVTLPKSNARTDWLQRPLSNAQLEYAMDDVRYLLPLYHSQVQSLREKNRERWLEDDFALLSRPELYRVDEDSCWQRIRGTNRLRGVQLAVLRGVARWRELTARQSNRPRRWIINDDALLEIAQRMPVQETQFDTCPAVKQIKAAFKHELLEEVRKARSLPEAQWPHMPRYESLTLTQEALADACMAIVKQCAQDNNIAASMLATRKEIENFIHGRKDCSFLSGWRYQLVGIKLEAFKQGRCGLRVSSGHLILSDETE